MKNISIVFFLLCLILLNTNCTKSKNPLNDEIPSIALSQTDAQFSNDGETIVFYGSYDSIYAVHFVDFRGNYLGHILSNNVNISFPTWSPDNQKIAVLMEGYIYTVKIDGDSLTKLPKNVGGNFGNWSPDGRYIAFTIPVCDPECGIGIYDFKKNTEKIIGQYGSYASWSSDSKKVYYRNNFYITDTETQKGDYKGFVFKRIDINTLKEDSLFYVAKTDLHLWLEDCTVSPNEKEILFAASYGSPPIINIWKINLQNNEMVQITSDGGDYPAYNPSGDKIVYTNSNINEGGLWIMNSDGSNKQRITKLRK